MNSSHQESSGTRPNRSAISAALLKVLPWAASIALVFLLAVGMLFLQDVSLVTETQVTVRRIDVALPPPPPQTPPQQIQQAQTNSPLPTIDLMGNGEGLSMHYSAKPELASFKLEQVEKPKFDSDSLDFQKTLSLDFPVVEVKELDEIPRAVSSVNIRYPSSLSNRGIKRVSTKVELIIDQRGKAYIKKIVDPVYPEMIDPIREWVAKVQFSIPTKNGHPIQAIYLYTLNFVYRI